MLTRTCQRVVGRGQEADRDLRSLQEAGREFRSQVEEAGNQGASSSRVEEARTTSSTPTWLPQRSREAYRLVGRVEAQSVVLRLHISFSPLAYFANIYYKTVLKGVIKR